MEAQLKKSDSRHAIDEGTLDAVKIGAAESYLSALGVFLGASPIQLGMLATLPPLIGAMCQSAGVAAMEFVQSRRSLLVSFTRAQAFLVFLIALLPLFFSPGLQAAGFLILFTVLYHLTIGIIQPVWNSLVGDLIPPEQRGGFFSARNTRMALATFLSMILAGQVLSISKEYSHPAYGFLVIFLLSAFARFSCSWFSAKLANPIRLTERSSKFTFWQFISKWRHSNFVRFVIFVASMQFAVNIAGPFFSLYLLRDLGFSYSQFTAIIAALFASQFVVMRFWGSIADQFGNKKILAVCAWPMALNPFLWFISGNIYWLLVAQFICGLFWAGFNLSIASFVFDVATPQKLARCVAYQAIVTGTFVFIASLLGGALIEYGGAFLVFDHGFDTPHSPLFTVFFLSGILRLGVAIFLLKGFKEVRNVKHISHKELYLRIVSIRPLTGLAFGVFGKGK